MTVRVLLLTPSRLLGELLAAAATSRGLHLLAARPAADVALQVRRARVDAVLADLRLTDPVWRALLGGALLGGALPPVLVLGGPAPAAAVLDRLESGAAGVVPLDGDLDEAVGMLQAGLDGRVAVPDRLFGGLLGVLVVRRRHASVASSRLDRLTAREREVLDLLVEGADQRGIAAALVISPQTARTHIAHVLAKLEVHSRHEAVALAVRLERQSV